MNDEILNWKGYLKKFNSYANTPFKYGLDDVIYAIGCNSNITVEDFIANPGIEWDYSSLSSNRNIPVAYMLSTIAQYPWDLSHFFKMIHFIELYPLTEIKFNYSALSCNRTIPFSYILKHKNEDWNWSSVMNYILSEYDYHTYQYECEDIFHKNHLIYFYTCINLSVKFIYELSKQYTNQDFITVLSSRAPLKFILQNTFNWNWIIISKYETITCTDIISNPELPWRYDFMSTRKDLTIDLYKHLIDKGHNYINLLSSSECITINDVVENPDIPWDYDYLSMNPNITWVEINNHPNLPWEFENIAHNQMTCPAECKKNRILFNEVLKELSY